MLDVKLDRRDPLPLYDQVCAEIRRAIADGEIGPGERFPPARDLVRYARKHGYDRAELIRIIESIAD